MTVNRITYYIILAVSLLLSGACSNTRFLADDELLYTGKDHVIVYDSVNYSNRDIKRIVKSTTSYKPNNAIGGTRVLPPVGLWIYNYRKPPEDKESGGWLYRNLASEPVLVSTVNPELRCRKIESDLFNIGYFHADVKSEQKINEKNSSKAKIIYYVKPGRPYTYDSILFTEPEAEVDSLISNYKNYLSIRPGEVFNLRTVMSESQNIAEMAQDSGYYYFTPEEVKWAADTTRTPYHIDMEIGRKKRNKPEAGMKYIIGNITVTVSSEDQEQNAHQNSDTLLIDGIEIISKDKYIVKNGIITGSIPFRSGDYYSSQMYRQTITRLNNLGIFKFINIQFQPQDDNPGNKLDMLIELVVLKNISLDIEANLVSKSTGFAGPGLVTTLAHGNLGGTATKLQLRLYGGFEWQVNSSSETNTGTMSYQAGASASVSIPGIMIPFRAADQGRFNMPQTSVTVGFELLNKIRYYRMYSFNLGFGYQWNINENISHQLFPVQVNSAKLLNTTTEFDSLLTENPYIRKSFEEQYIAGSRYVFTYDKSNPGRPHSFYIQTGLKTAGNLISLLSRGDGGDTDNPDTFLGNVYSQFFRVSADIRYFRNYGNQQLGFRFFSGTGIPYGNSVVMPYVEQFYSGGSNSIRAFPARSVGPGGYKPAEMENIVDYTGDMKLEFNMEYRFRLTKVFHGALFVDIGNIWLLNRDDSRPGAEFRFDTFTDQLAVGTGFGFRFDLSFFVLRADIGLPLRRPYETDGAYWLGSRKEVRKNATFNFAIGYPF